MLIDEDKPLNLKLIDFEYIGLMIATGYTFLKSELLYENTGDMKYVYITFITFMLFIYALMKLKILNVFRFVNRIPIYLRIGLIYMISDYKYWRANGVRKHE